MSRHHLELVQYLGHRARQSAALARSIPQGMTAGEIVDRLDQAEDFAQDYERELRRS